MKAITVCSLGKQVLLFSGGATGGLECGLAPQSPKVGRNFQKSDIKLVGHIPLE